MTSRDFCYWLQGHIEMAEAAQGGTPGPGAALALNAHQVAMLKAHLALVFKHEIDPSYGTPEHQAELQQLHDKVAALERRPPGGQVIRC